MSSTRTHPQPETKPSSAEGRYERYLERLEEERKRDEAKGSASRAIGYRRPRREADYGQTIADPTAQQTRLYQRETLRSPVAHGKLVIRVVNEYGKPEMTIFCNNIAQCREVVRVETPLYEPGSLFFISDGNRPVENWAVGKDGLPRRGRVR
jgi:hypothetical protein